MAFECLCFSVLKKSPPKAGQATCRGARAEPPLRHGAAGAGGAVRNNTVNYCPGNPRGCYTTKVTCGSDALLGAELPAQRSISVCSQGSAAVPPARLCSVRTWPCAAGSPAEAPAPAGSAGDAAAPERDERSQTCKPGVHQRSAPVPPPCKTLLSDPAGNFNSHENNSPACLLMGFEAGVTSRRANVLGEILI